MTDQELKDLVASFALENREIDLRLKEIDRRLEKLESKSNFEGIDIRIDNIDENLLWWYRSERFFQDVFREKLEFGGIKYDEMIPLIRRDRYVKIEFDVALLKENSVALIAVKYSVHPNFVKELAEDIVGKFRKYFPDFYNCDIYLGIAGFSFSDEILDRASTYGIGIVRQVDVYKS